ncbi:MAG: tetratricopeptide repeat protein [Treponema sp.]|nr:tetratricopeptide repeat protein [Treponema sp.]MEE3434977.1 tetratricopeptide repeat protein [Treponema sp.]
MKNCVKSVLALVLAGAVALSLPLFALDYGAARVNSREADDGRNSLLGAAYNAYAQSDWQSAVMLFRKALSDPQNESDSALYMLVMAEMQSKGYKAALSDTAYFLKSYSDSRYASLIKYQQGRSLYFLGEFDKAVLVLSDFCHQNPNDEMYAAALFLIAECFYAGYNFEQARPLYERVVDEFPKDPKAVDAKYRLDAINQRLREEKLLYLLQQTGESYLSSKENYEKALRRYELESALGAAVPARAEESAAAEKALEGAVETVLSDEAVTPVSSESAASASPSDQAFESALEKLKRSAAEAQALLDQNGGQK